MSVQLRTLLNNKKIPYFAMKIKRKVKEGDTKITKVCSGLPDGWQKYTFEQAMEWNEKFDEKPNAMNVVIKNTNYVDRDGIASDNSEGESNEETVIPVHQARTKFKSTDLLVPWKLNGETYHRFYHVFKQGEIEDILSNIKNVEIDKVF